MADKSNQIFQREKVDSEWLAGGTIWRMLLAAQEGAFRELLSRHQKPIIITKPLIRKLAKQITVLISGIVFGFSISFGSIWARFVQPRIHGSFLAHRKRVPLTNHAQLLSPYFHAYCSVGLIYAPELCPPSPFVQVSPGKAFGGEKLSPWSYICTKAACSWLLNGWEWKRCLLIS